MTWPVIKYDYSVDIQDFTLALEVIIESGDSMFLVNWSV